MTLNSRNKRCNLSPPPHKHFFFFGSPLEDTDDIIEELWEVEFSPLLDGGDNFSQHLLLLRPLILDEDQELPQGVVILRIGQDNILSGGVGKGRVLINKEGIRSIRLP